MSDAIKHECGIAMIHLRKPYSYYVEKYGPLYALSKMYLLMEKQRNRGQDGAGLAVIRKNTRPGQRFISRKRSIDSKAIEDIFKNINGYFEKAFNENPEEYNNGEWLKDNVPYSGEVLLGHLRYGTHGKNSIENCHPMLRPNNWRSRNLIMAGNFNLTNVDELFDVLIDLGQHPKEKSDTVTVMEKVGHYLDEEVERWYDFYKSELTKREVTNKIEESIDIEKILKKAFSDFDGGYAMAGLTGYGASFVVRDPSGIRPAHYYADDEIIVVASEKAAIKTSFNVEYSDIQEITPGNALIMNKDGSYSEKEILAPLERKSCSFERIYFSRGTDPAVYNERKKLGQLLCPKILEMVDYDLNNTVFSYIPNTAETSWIGMMQGLEDYLRGERKKVIANKKSTPEEIDNVLSLRTRVEKIVIKDAKLRTFITDNDSRNDLVAHVYDTTYEVIEKNTDTLVVIDDSIVRGTTLEKSILAMLKRLEPKRIIIVSAAPQIRYPDCYGIDMSRMREFIAFRAVLELLKDHGKEDVLHEVYAKCKEAQEKDQLDKVNFVKPVYESFSNEEISKKIAEMVTPDNTDIQIDVLFQTVEDLHEACPNDLGDWYFTGDFPTPGGMKVVNRSFMYFMEGSDSRAY